jgi:Na+/H+ antiporter NhaA
VISTDTAFLLAALALVAPASHARLRVFLLALSVVDDVGALTVIAIFYTAAFQLIPLLIAVVGLVLTWFAARLPAMWRRPTYALLWTIVWFAVLASGVEPTLAGVAIALVIPASRPDRNRAESIRELADDFGKEPTAEAARDLARTVRQTISVNERLEASITPWVSFVILPAFALANAGLQITPDVVAGALTSSVTWGIIVALVVGKFAGVFGATALLKVLRIGDFGSRLDYRRLAGGSALCGIGFTISLYVIDMAMTGAAAQNEARLGILVAGLVATLLAAGLFRLPSGAKRAAAVA